MQRAVQLGLRQGCRQVSPFPLIVRCAETLERIFRKQVQLEGEELTQVELWERALRTEQFAELAASLQATVGWAPDAVAREMVAIQSVLSEHEYTDYQGCFHCVDIPVSWRPPPLPAAWLPGCWLARAALPPGPCLRFCAQPACWWSLSPTCLVACLRATCPPPGCRSPLQPCMQSRPFF